MVSRPVVIDAGIQAIHIAGKQVNLQGIQGACRWGGPETAFIGYALGGPQQLRNRLQGQG